MNDKLSSGDIQILSDELISQIAAGEVIERPASALKELVENSLDAGATHIAVELEEGGLRHLRVVDNGSGIRREDVRLAFERHATSKLRSVDELFSIRSLGFRGEALASIASIAQVVLRTRHRDERLGTEMEMDGGKEVRFEEAACDAGTDIRIWGLFKHTPARKKYMKSERTEYGRCFDMLSKVALAHPEVGFRLKRDGKEVFALPAGQSLKERIRALYGGSTTEALLELRYEASHLKIRGFVGKPELSRRSRKYQFLFVNGRPVEDRSLGHAVKEAFHSLLMHEKYPWYLLQIDVAPEMVDVNVHPRKLEVKFVNPREVFSAVLGAVKHALQDVMLAPMPASTSLPSASFSPSPVTQARLTEAPATHQPLVRFPERDMSPPVIERDHRPVHGPAFTLQGVSLRPVAQIAHSYIVAESEEGLVLIDQHAAHERVRYAKLMEALEKEEKWMQPLLTPLELDLGAASAQVVEAHIDDFEALGFELEAFGGHSYLLRSVPAGISKREPEQVVKEVIADLKEAKKSSAVKDVREALLTMTACRGAIKFGDALTMVEMQALLRDMETTPHCDHCPHGRPAIVTLSFDKLETLFKRKNF